MQLSLVKCVFISLIVLLQNCFMHNFHSWWDRNNVKNKLNGAAIEYSRPYFGKGSENELAWLNFQYRTFTGMGTQNDNS